MTEVYDLLTTGPQTQVDVSRLNFEERQELCRISVTRTSDVTNIGESGDFSTIYYLDGDERQAAAVFVDENRELLTDVDFSKKNILQTSMPRTVYDWILHALGKRELEKYETVVLEERPDGTRWVIDRQKYDESPNRRYTVREQHSARVDDLSLAELYDEFEDEIVQSALTNHSAVMGDTRYILAYFHASDSFECHPVTIDGEMALRKDDMSDGACQDG